MDPRIDNNSRSSYYRCTTCLNEFRKIRLDEHKRFYCLECFDKLGQQFSSIRCDLPMKMQLHQSSNGIQKISNSFIDELIKSSVEVSVIKVNLLLKNKHLLCVAQEIQNYALVKRSDNSWTCGVIVPSDKSNDISVCLNAEATLKKSVPMGNSLMIPLSLMKSIDSSNNTPDLNIFDKKFVMNDIINVFVEWGKMENHD